MFKNLFTDNTTKYGMLWLFGTTILGQLKDFINDVLGEFGITYFMSKPYTLEAIIFIVIAILFIATPHNKVITLLEFITKKRV